MTVYTGLGILLFLMGAGALGLRRGMIQQLLAINVMGIGIFMCLIAGANRSGVIDHVPHALVLTGIVVAVSATAFGLSLALKLHDMGGADPGDDR